MIEDGIIKPDFLIVGAQKCGTTWLWEVLKQHQDTDLGNKKEIFFFNSSHNYLKGTEWYYSHFSHLNPNKVIGEASTDYLYDHVLIDNLEIDFTLPVIPELIKSTLPKIKIFILIRDPVRRAISAYYHHMRNRVFSPYLGIRDVLIHYPHLRIIERGYYTRYLKLYWDYFNPENMRIYVLEEDVINAPIPTIQNSLEFVGIDNIVPNQYDIPRNVGWGWIHILLNYYLGYRYGKLYILARKIFPKNSILHLDILHKPDINPDDIRYLSSLYLPEKHQLESILRRNLNNWDYGNNLNNPVL